MFSAENTFFVFESNSNALVKPNQTENLGSFCLIAFIPQLCIVVC